MKKREQLWNVLWNLSTIPDSPGLYLLVINHLKVKIMITELEVRMMYHSETGKYPINESSHPIKGRSLRGELKPDKVEDIMPYLKWIEEKFIEYLNKPYHG